MVVSASPDRRGGVCATAGRVGSYGAGAVLGKLLGKTRLRARQCSRRGGELLLDVVWPGDSSGGHSSGSSEGVAGSVLVGGRCALVSRGELLVDLPANCESRGPGRWFQREVRLTAAGPTARPAGSSLKPAACYSFRNRFGSAGNYWYQKSSYYNTS